MRAPKRGVVRLSAVAGMLAIAAAGAAAQAPASDDPRVGLRAGWNDAAAAASNMELVAHVDRPDGFFNAQALGDILLANSDMAFQGDYLFMGSFHGFNVYDVSDPSEPTLRTSFPCPGGQGDLSVHGDLLFMSVEMPNGRLDCGAQGVTGQASPDRFRGVRIFDISNLDRPRQVGAVQTCRGSHTHTLVTDPDDDRNVYIYVSGTSTVRPAEELAGCSAAAPDEDPNTSYFRIEVIRVPVAAPQNAEIVNTPRIFAEGGDIAGLWAGGDHGPGTQTTSTTNQCHDITVYPYLELAAGACSGNGILLDISDPANPVRIDEVSDPNFAYWHSATFNNDGTTVLFTDEWGGGTQARCRSTDRPEWGANAFFTRSNGQLEHVGYYKLPVPQTATENCVAHNGSLVPVPGRDIKVQAWYQGGVSVFDFTDPSNPVEIAFFDRGPMSADELLLGGAWSSYWHNGRVYTSEIGRGLDVLRLLPSDHLTQNELDAAALVAYETFNPQTQPHNTWPTHISVARAYADQLQRSRALPAQDAQRLVSELARASRLGTAARRAVFAQLRDDVAALRLNPSATDADARRLERLAQQLADLSAGR